jgi:hypothetical protein
MAWIFNDGSGSTVDQSAANFAAHVYRLKSLLKAVGWTHVASSDGTNVSNTFGNGNDQIGSAAEMANNNAWYVLAQPAIARGIGYPGNRQIIIRRGTADANWLIAYVPPNTDGSRQAIAVNGTTAAIPTFGTTQIQVGTLPDTTASWSGVSSKNWSIGAEDAAPYCFYFVGYQVSGGAPDTGGILFLDAIEPGTGEPDDLDPCVIYAVGSGGSLDSTGTTGLSSVTGAKTDASHGPFCYWRRGLAGETFGNVALGILAVWNQPTSSRHAVLPGGLGRTPGGSSYDETPLRPLWVAGGENAGNASGDMLGLVCGIKGASHMLRWRSGAQPFGFMLTEHTAKDRCVYGDVTLPHDGSTTIAVTG